MIPLPFEVFTTETTTNHRCEFEQADQFHVLELMPSIRQIDRESWFGDTGFYPEDLLPQMVRSAETRWTLLVDAKVVCIICVLPCEEDRTVGFLYFACSRYFEDSANASFSSLQSLARALNDHYSCVIGYVDARSNKAIRYLRRLGLNLHSPAPHGANQAPFRKYTLGGIHV